ncbi:MAG: gluconate 2-dehydrogenase subunit 3 family protein [Candidatus Neomarinimicrobiota bacterium]
MDQDNLKSAIKNYESGIMDRRTFLITAGVFAGSITLGGLLSYYYKSTGKKPIFSLSQDVLMSTVQEHLFPANDDSPGAADINALPYLHFVLADPDMDQDNKNLLVNGVKWIEEESRSSYQKSIVSLSFGELENVLQSTVNKSWGQRWLSLNLLYIFEALLSDPLYGGNPDGIGWKWLEHNPGFPRPTKNKIYGKL